ncbi:hypothetical protein [Cellulophaga omnivescoria]|uniref:hypothetical protein n=1 Tax=Cellulophaga omnivescoria TaxID=1888890 RepID=UPI0009868AEE|nr:hypothetical protein [Cellulophaga omnivescoria]
MSNIQTSIIEKVKTELNITENVDAFGLYDILFKSRNIAHPDLVGTELKSEATEKFKRLNELLQELKVHLDGLKLTKSPQELVLFQNNYESVIDKSQILELEKKNKHLKLELSLKEDEVDRLKKIITKSQEDKSEELNTQLKNLYEPKNSSFLVLGISAFLLLFINIVSQITDLKESITELIPFNIVYLNYFLFGLLVFIGLKLYFKNWQLKKIRNIAEILKSSKTISDFFAYNGKEHEDYYKRKYFLESDLENFINSRYSNQKYRGYDYRYRGEKSLYRYQYKRLVGNIKSLFSINDQKSLNYLRDIFIYNLLTKGHIRFGKTDNLDREFIAE